MSWTMRRKVIEEASVGLCLMVPKTLWSRLPRPGAGLMARVNGVRRRLHVASVPCLCRGQEKPHEHRFLKLPAAARHHLGDFVVIEMS